MKVINALDKIIFFLLLLALLSIVMRAECEILNLDTGLCESHDEQNLTSNKKWREFW